MARVPAAQLRNVSKAPTGGDLKGILDYVRQYLPTALTDIATNTFAITAHTILLGRKADKKLTLYSVPDAVYVLVPSTADALTKYTSVVGATLVVNVGVFAKGEVIQAYGSAGKLTVSPVGVTVRTPATLKSRAIYSAISLICLTDAGDEFLLMGDLEI